MAIKMTIETKSGISVENAYIRISEQSGTKDSINLRVRSYVSKEKADEGYAPVDEDKVYSFTPSVSDGATNFIQQGYGYIKTLPEFADAVDC